MDNEIIIFILFIFQIYFYLSFYQKMLFENSNPTRTDVQNFKYNIILNFNHN